MEGTNFLLVVCFIAFSYVLADSDHGTVAPSYTIDNFKDELAKKPHFVMFFAPWCGHCKRLAPTWDQLAEVYNSDLEGKEALIAKVDCTAETKLCSQHEVQGYPTLKFFSAPDDSLRYRGSRELAALSTFVKEQLEGEEEAEEEAKAPEPKGPTVVKGLYELTDENFKDHIAKGFHFVKFFAPWCGHCQRMAPSWEKLGETFENNAEVTIAKVDCTAQRETCKEHGVSGYPTILWMKDGEKVEKYHGSRDHADLKIYVDRKVELDKEPLEQVEEKIPEPAGDSEVLLLDSSNFEENTKTGTAFVKFYAPWCGHCKNMAAAWEDLGKKFAGNKNVKIAKVDCTVERELCGKQDVKGFPTLLMFRNGEQAGEHNGGRDVDSLYNFVKDKTPHDEL